MLGRVANNLYWMARYLERAENNARLIETAFRRSLSRLTTLMMSGLCSIVNGCQRRL